MNKYWFKRVQSDPRKAGWFLNGAGIVPITIEGFLVTLIWVVFFFTFSQIDPLSIGHDITITDLLPLIVSTFLWFVVAYAKLDRSSFAQEVYGHHAVYIVVKILLVICTVLILIAGFLGFVR